jgi:hypothetical protein
MARTALRTSNYANSPESRLAAVRLASARGNRQGTTLTCNALTSLPEMGRDGGRKSGIHIRNVETPGADL